MPKMKMKKGGAQGLAIPSSLDAEDLAAEPLVDTAAGSLAEWTESLGSEEDAQREVAMGSIAMMLAQQGNAELALAQNLHSTIIGMLGSDTNSAVRADAAGALRNLATAGVDRAAAELVAAGVVKAISSTFPMAAGQLIRGGGGAAAAAAAAASASADTEGSGTTERVAMLAIVEQLGHLLAVLCESSAEAAAAVTRTAVSAMVLRCIGVDGLPPSTVYALATCLQTLSEDNAPVARLIHGSPETLEVLAALLTYEGRTRGESSAIRSAAAGICINVGVVVPGGAVVLALTESAGYDSAADLPGVAVQLPKLARESKGGDDLRADLRDFDELLSAQQNALEVLANLCVGGGAGEEDGGGGGGAAAEWEAEIEAIVVALAEGGTANAVLTLCVPLDSGLQQVFAGHAEKGRPILSKYVQVQSRALTFLQNLLTRINAAEDVEFATTLLRYGGGLCVDPPLGHDEAFVDSASGAVWAVLRGCTDAGKLDELELTTDQCEAFCELFKTLPPTSVAAVNVLGLLGCVGQATSVAPALCGLGGALIGGLESGLAVLADDGSPWLVAEALNSIFDVFAEPEVNEVVATLNMMDALQASLAALEIAHGSGSVGFDGTEKLVEAAENLTRFLEYKRDQK